MNNLKSGGTLFLAYEGRMGRANEPCTKNQTMNQTINKTMNKTMNRTKIHEP